MNEAKPKLEDWIRVFSMVGQIVVNIDRGYVTVERDSPAHRALKDLCDYVVATTTEKIAAAPAMAETLSRIELKCRAVASQFDKLAERAVEMTAIAELARAAIKEIEP